MRISDWSSDVCSSDLGKPTSSGQGDRCMVARASSTLRAACMPAITALRTDGGEASARLSRNCPGDSRWRADLPRVILTEARLPLPPGEEASGRGVVRSEEHTAELQSLMRNSYAVFC